MLLLLLVMVLVMVLVLVLVLVMVMVRVVHCVGVAAALVPRCVCLERCVPLWGS